MDSFRILWKSSSEHDIKRIDRQYIPRILDAVEALATNPFPSWSRKLKGLYRSYRIRIGLYRVIYQVDTTEKIITVYHVRHRKDAYSSPFE
ncbi:MAG: type II toxin-antitoxin system RelE/ParE family toxin [Nitrospirae bacterium]|nr:type II toxin-antitoxin system RelE/ParE family toxin [Nitrospirota bacterium]